MSDTAGQSLRERLAAAMRAARFGNIRPTWNDLPEGMREHWRTEADALLITARNRDIEIKDAESGSA